jgi:hypothetical protein
VCRTQRIRVQHFGLSKSSVQNALRHLRERGPLDPDVVATVTDPLRRPLRPWVR